MDHAYKSIELTGSSGVGPKEAIEGAIGRAAQSLRDMRWFEVVGIRGDIEQDHVNHWQVTLKIGFTLEE